LLKQQKLHTTSQLQLHNHSTKYKIQSCVNEQGSSINHVDEGYDQNVLERLAHFDTIQKVGGLFEAITLAG